MKREKGDRESANGGREEEEERGRSEDEESRERLNGEKPDALESCRRLGSERVPVFTIFAGRRREG